MASARSCFGFVVNVNSGCDVEAWLKKLANLAVLSVKKEDFLLSLGKAGSEGCWGVETGV